MYLCGYPPQKPCSFIIGVGGEEKARFVAALQVLALLPKLQRVPQICEDHAKAGSKPKQLFMLSSELFVASAPSQTPPGHRELQKPGCDRDVSTVLNMTIHVYRAR